MPGTGAVSSIPRLALAGDSLEQKHMLLSSVFLCSSCRQPTHSLSTFLPVCFARPLTLCVRLCPLGGGGSACVQSAYPAVYPSGSRRRLPVCVHALPWAYGVQRCCWKRCSEST